MLCNDLRTINAEDGWVYMVGIQLLQQFYRGQVKGKEFPGDKTDKRHQSRLMGRTRNGLAEIYCRPGRCLLWIE